MRFIPLKAFDNPTEAHIVKGLLLDNGIPCFLKDENFVSAYPLYSQAVGGIRLMIREEDFERATGILSETDTGYKTTNACPNCGSEAVYFVTDRNKTLNWLSVIIAFLTFSYPFYLNKKFECAACKTVFDIK